MTTAAAVMGNTINDEFLSFIHCITYESTSSSEQMIADFNTKDGTLSDMEFGLASLRIAIKIEKEGKYPEQALYFANKAFKAFDKNQKDDTPNKNFMFAAFTLNVIGHCHSELYRFHDAIGFLLKCNTMVCKMLEEDGLNSANVWAYFYGVLPELARAYFMGQNYKEALPFILKALELQTQFFAPKSDAMCQQAYCRSILANIYCGLGQYTEAMKHDFEAQKIYKRYHRHSDFLRAKIHAADMMIELQRYDEAIGNLKSIVQGKVDKVNVSDNDRALALILMARCYANQEKFGECKKHLDRSLEILYKIERSSPVEVADAYEKICSQYEVMKDYESAISLHEKTLAFLDLIPKEQCRQGSVSRRIGMLLVLKRRWEKAIPYFERALEKFKRCYGEKHFKVGGIYNSLGEANLRVGKLKLAAKEFALAKDIFDVSLDPNHVYRIAACENLAKAHDKMGRYEVAIEFQKLAINAQNGHGASGEAKLKEANRVLEEFQKKAFDASAKKKSAGKALP